MKKAIVIIGALLVLSSCSDDKPTKTDIELSAEHYVEQLLKSPSTAEFGVAEVIEVKEGVFSVKSHVDSQNEFGATVRTVQLGILVGEEFE